MNPRFQTDCNSKLKRESYSWLNQDCAKSIATQWCWIQLKIGAIFYKIFGENPIWFWILGSQESNALNGFQFGVETNEIWLIEARLHKGHAIRRLSLGQLVFRCLGSIFGPLFGLFFCGNWVHWFFFFH